MAIITTAAAATTTAAAMHRPCRKAPPPPSSPRAPRTAHHAPRTKHHAPHTMHHTPRTTHQAAQNMTAPSARITPHKAWSWWRGHVLRYRCYGSGYTARLTEKHATAHGAMTQGPGESFSSGIEPWGEHGTDAPPVQLIAHPTHAHGHFGTQLFTCTKARGVGGGRPRLCSSMLIKNSIAHWFEPHTKSLHNI